MTGFGRAEVVTKERKITIELKSVNHRYLDLSIKMPRKLNFLEGAVRNLMKTYIQRGKVDVYITYEDYTLDNGALKYNRELASEYITCLKQMQQDFDLDYDIKVSTLNSLLMRKRSGNLWNRPFARHVRNLSRQGYWKAEILRKTLSENWTALKKKYYV